jgi:hypothetical protein
MPGSTPDEDSPFRENENPDLLHGVLVYFRGGHGTWLHYESRDSALQAISFVSGFLNKSPSDRAACWSPTRTVPMADSEGNIRLMDIPMAVFDLREVAGVEYSIRPRKPKKEAWEDDE